MKVSILIPAYNEEKIISQTLISIEKTLKDVPWQYEMIVVCDGGKDNTFATAQKHRDEHIKIFGYPRNRGKGHALKYGFGQSTGDLVVFFDAGLEFDPKHIIKIVDYYQKTKTPVIIGSKRHPDSKVIYPFKRQVLSRAAQVMVALLFRLSVKDSQVGLKLFRREVLGKIFPKILVKKFAFDIELLSLAHHYGYAIQEIPVSLKMDFSHSSVNFRGVQDCFFDTLAIFYRLHILRYYDKPPKVREAMLKKYSSQK